MQPIRKALFATAIAAGFIANAQAAATIQTLDITWYKAFHYTQVRRRRESRLRSMT
ncbi:hypothetical protein SAMN05192539_106618 [Paraburkholderia diazotrophica]|uniref:NitT/TauT family transport system substrate-binding protein n=1 Tax=Paraburkholderia diazotrophica TaxID=667676 RepID=A0A1H7ENV0_9BURK|nr:hypothetical protein SAMN05192539_106618 [Paraburkholderia diazotrophica]